MRTKSSTSVGAPEIGQWYARGDKGEQFRVIGRDDESRTVEIQMFDGDVDEIDAETWSTLSLERIEPPEDPTAPLDDVELDDLGYTETGMAKADWAQPLQPLAATREAWEDTEPEEERDPLGDGTPAEPFVADEDEAATPE